ncbi:MAG: GNAT family N-acetyltransferase [Clostridium sp.]|jgi:ribosomal protein S18 acetylase RimI-like enzyme|nr:GNAT family N-acetyltransferase [Clostridium sp.]
MELRLVKIEDINVIDKIFKHSIENMIKNNIFQWDEIYPNKEILENDIRKNQMYKIILNSNIVSVFVLNKEYDKEYLSAKWEYDGNNFVILHRLCVNAEYQNRGFGVKTMLCIEKHLKNNGIESIRLDVFSKNPIALKLYNKLGYKRTGEATGRKGLFYFMEKIMWRARTSPVSGKWRKP